MPAVLLDAGAPAGFLPLTGTRPLAACPVANRPLAAWQRERLAAVASAARLTQRGDAWLAVADLAALAASAAPATLVDAEGAPLAWTGGDEVAPAGATLLRAGSGAFRLRYPWDLLRINEELVGALAESRIEGDLSPHAHVEGRLVLGRGSRILPGVFVEGNVIVGEGCKIGPNAYLRGATAIGDRCHVGQAVEVKNSILMAGASLGHLSYCGDSIVGEKVNFGAGTITANFRHDGAAHRSTVGGALVDTGRRKFGAIVGDGVHTGIHTSLYPGRKLWPGVSTRPGAIVQRDVERNG